MIKAELDKYKKLLLEKKEEVLKAMKQIETDNLRSQKDSAGDLSGYTLHMADVATNSYDREFNLGLASNAKRILYEISEALKRIKDKTFGTCQDCEKPIAKKRLNAIPYASLCIACQSKQEIERRGTSSGRA